MKSKLPNSVLRRVWALSDLDGDGMLDRDEFAVAMFLIDHKLSGNDLPEKLPDRVIPPGKRSLVRKANNNGSPATRPGDRGYSGERSLAGGDSRGRGSMGGSYGDDRGRSHEDRGGYEGGRGGTSSRYEDGDRRREDSSAGRRPMQEFNDDDEEGGGLGSFIH